MRQCDESQPRVARSSENEMNSLTLPMRCSSAAGPVERSSVHLSGTDGQHKLGLISGHKGNQSGHQMIELSGTETAGPDDGNPPPLVPQLAQVSCITGNIGRKLAGPEIRACRRFGSVLAADVAMPETAMHKDNHMVSGQHDVRPARQTPIVQPEPEAPPMKRRTQHTFRFRVPPPYPGHHPRPGPRFHDIQSGVLIRVSRSIMGIVWHDRKQEAVS